MKVSIQLRLEHSFVEGYLGTREICSTCKTSLREYADKCTAGLSDLCPGFEAIEEAKQRFKAHELRARKALKADGK